MAIAACALTGCTVIEHVQVLPIVNPMTDDVSCCVAYAEIPPSTHLSVAVKKGNDGVTVTLGVRRRF